MAESYGGRDEPVDTLVASLVDVGVSPLGAALRVKDAPGEGTYQLFEEVKRGGLGWWGGWGCDVRERGGLACVYEGQCGVGEGRRGPRRTQPHNLHPFSFLCCRPGPTWPRP